MTRDALWVWLLLGAAGQIGAQARAASMHADRERLAELGIPQDSARGIRGLPDSIPLRVHRWPVVVRPLYPSITVVWNSAIPWSMNDGALWAGRGTSIAVLGGAQTSIQRRNWRLDAIVAPELLYSENRPFLIRPDTTTGRSSFASPFHRGRTSADLPLRFGDRHLLRVDPGRSALTVTSGPVSISATADLDAWGPGIRNQLVMSGNGPGIPRMVVRTNEALPTPLGKTSARIISGVLTESQFFDDDPGNDVRSISGVLIELQPAFDSLLTIGIARVVSRPIPASGSRLGAVMSRPLDAILRWKATGPADSNAVVAPADLLDQMAGVFFRWIFPVAGFETYGEWARLELPRSLTELLAAQHHSLGYTLGLQWALRRRTNHSIRLQGEVTNLEQSKVFSARPSPDFYTGRAAPQGFTNRGQVIGAAIGPGGSSQWVAVDHLSPRWQFGGYVGRIRWETDAMYREPIPTHFMHDVTVFAGVRAGRRTRAFDVALDFGSGYRFNYLFQNGTPNPGGYGFRTVDVRNLTLATSITPR